MRESRAVRVTAVALFTTLAVVLNLTVKIPAPFAPFLLYEVWEIPIVDALLIFGGNVAVSVAVLNTLTLIVIFPGALPTGPLYNLIAFLSMLLGVILGHKSGNALGRGRGTQVAAATLLGTISRVAVMTLLSAIVLPLPFPLGFNLPAQAILATLVVTGAFNTTVALYTVPLAYAVLNAISSRISSVAYPLTKPIPNNTA